MVGSYGQEKTSPKVKRPPMSPLKFMRRTSGAGDRRAGGGGGGHDPDYEEVGPVKILLKHTPDGRGDGIHCEVCGSAQAAVRCESCSGQVFCAACDDVFHKHPRRTAHVRKAMEGVRPPLPPKGSEGGQGMPPPQPPPRKNKRTFLGGGGFNRKDQHLTGSLMCLPQAAAAPSPAPRTMLVKSNSVEGPADGNGGPGGRTIMGSLKRFMGSRPLPPPPAGAAHRGETGGSAVHSNLIRSLTSPNLAHEDTETSMALAIPQTVVDLSNSGRKYQAPPPPRPLPPSTRTPPPPPQQQQYPALMPPKPLHGGAQQHNHQQQQHGSLSQHQRKLSLQQAPVTRDEKRQSMIDGGSWDASGRYRSQSVSDEQWSQMLAAQGGHAAHAAPPQQFHDQTSGGGQRGRFNTVGGSTRGPGRGMMSSTSVCDLNTLVQQPQHPQQQMLQPGGMQQSGSFQQLNMVPYNGGMMWAPPCDMCHAPSMYPPQLPSHGMKRAASNVSMNMSSASSDVTGYPWQAPHMHHHMAPMYPGYYPAPPPPPHMMPTSMQGSSISIPDSMAAFSKVSSSPAPSVRSSSRRSHKSAKSRSFSTADLSRRTRSTHRSDSDETTTSSPSIDEDVINIKSGYPGGALAWQCDHCTFINQAGSRACGMCSKAQGASHQRSNRRTNSDRRRTERRYVGKRNDHDDDDRDPSDYENDGKHNGVSYNNRDNRRDTKSSKSSTTSRNKKKLRRRGGSSGSASDVVEELERQLSDMKLSRSRGPDYEGVSSRLKEQRERGSRRREGLSGRYKSRSKTASERSRTPGRPSPESPTHQGSPRDDSPQDDEVFATIESEEKKPESNSQSNEGTIIAPINSDETIVVTEYRKLKSDSRIRRSKSAISSRASTPCPVGEIHHAEVQILPPNEILNHIDSKPTDHLELPKPKEKSPSPFRQISQPDTEEPSFANTLDDIATMGTNEVADIDPFIYERPLSALPLNIDDIQQFIPTAKYIEPLSQNEEIKETALISQHEDYAYEKANSSSIKVEVNDIPEVKKETKIIPINDKSYETVEEPIEEMVEEFIPAETVENEQHAEIQEVESPYYQTEERPDIEYAAAETTSTNMYEEALDEAVKLENVVEYTSNRGSLEDINIRPASSLASSAGMESASHLDRQFTPLSFSSSDAAFYSPADSPDYSLSEKLRDRPSGSQTQTVIVLGAEDELVTALETLRSTNGDLRSSRETIRSSVDDLPYSELEELPDEEANGIYTSGPPPPEVIGRLAGFSGLYHNEGDSTPRTASPAGGGTGGYLSSDGYEGLSFQDAVYTLPDTMQTLHKSASDQMLSKSFSWKTEEQIPKGERRPTYTSPKEGKDERFLTVEELINRRKQETMKREGLELVQVLREAERAGFQAEEVSVALPLCGDRGPLEWLADNWRTMVDTVRTLATNYGRRGKREDDFGDISEQEARAALRAHRGNIWAAVTESVEQRQTKLAEVAAKGEFPREEVARALERHDGDVEAAYQDLSSYTAGENNCRDYQQLYQSYASPEQQQQVTTNHISAATTPDDQHQQQQQSQHQHQQPQHQQQQQSQQQHRERQHLQQQESIHTAAHSDTAAVAVVTDAAVNNAAAAEHVAAEALYVRKEDVVVHPLKAYTHYADLTASNYSDAEENIEEDNQVHHASSIPSKSGQPETAYDTMTVNVPAEEATTVIIRRKNNTNNESNGKTEQIEEVRKSRVVPKNKISTTGNDAIKEPTKEVDTAVVMRQKETSQAQPTEAKQEFRSSVSYEGSSDEADEESVSITTGRLSLTLSHSSEKEGAIDVTAATVQKEEIQTEVTPRIKTPTSGKSIGTITRKTDIRHIAELEASALSGTESTNQMQTTTNQQEDATQQQQQQPATATSSKDLNAILQPPVKKASSIIGKAIAKAIARETTAREGSPIYSPASSRGSTPASLTRESTPASSMLDSGDDSTPVSTTPMSTTPRSTPDLTEDGNSTMQVTVDSEDEDLLRSLDTIPEEEEFSERTESGRLLSRSSSRNLKLPFSPTSVILLGTPTSFKNKEKPPPAEPTSADQNHLKIDTVTEESRTTELNTNDEVPMTPIHSGDSDHYQDSRLSERSDENQEEDSDSSTPHQVDNDDDNSLAMIPQPSVDDNPDTPYAAEEVSSAETSQSTHNYYNTTGKPVENTYYNDSAAAALNAEKIEIDPNDYESMYSIKRDLDMLRESSSDFADKIDSLGTRDKRKGPVKDIGATKELKSALKQSSSQSALTTKSKSPESPSTPVSGAQLLAEENINTVKRSPKTTGLSKSATAPVMSSDSPTQSNIKVEVTEVQNSEPVASSSKTKVTKSKLKQKKKSDSEYSSSDQTDGSKSNEDTTVIQNNVSNEAGANTETKTAASEKPVSKQDSSPAVEEEKPAMQTLTVKPKIKSPSVAKTSGLRSPGSGPSAFSPPQTLRKSTPKSSPMPRAMIDSSGESEDEDKGVLSQRVSLERRLLLPNLLDKLEGLKGREPDYAEVQELKQQITDLKRTLQAQMSEDESDGGPALSPVPRMRIQSGTGTPTITLEPPATTGEEGAETSGALKPARTEEEATQYEQLRFDRTVRRLLAEGQAGSYEKAELAAHLLSLSFDEDESIVAAQECSSIYSAMHFLQQDCELCAEKYPMGNMVSMLYCTHRCCMQCAKTYFTYQIKTKNIREMRCPFCNEPNLETPEEAMTEYFNHLDILLKGIVDDEAHELFQRKLRDLTLMSDPNFRWCNKCSSGFIANPRARKLICPDCKDVTCAHCRLQWEAQHDGISCDVFATWKHENDPEAQAQGVAKHLAENGITCPKCKFTYSLAKGGCMHFTCTECKYEFCSGCGQPFRQGAKCPVGPYCERLGLHAHHPRNCLFYLRDKDPPQLQELLKENNVPFDTQPADSHDEDQENRRCQVPEQKETPDGLVDDTCGRVVLQGNAGLCRLHYIEYLVEKINSHHLDPVIIFDEADLRVCLRRNGKAVPIRRWESEKLYRDKLIKLIKEQLPL